MKLTAWTTLASLLMYVWIIGNVIKARVTHKIDAPATTGPIEFLTALRIQNNTVEQFVLFLPLLWLCGFCLSDMVAAILGVLWIVGRIIYAFGYAQAAHKRHLGFGIATAATVGLFIASVVGLIIH